MRLALYQPDIPQNLGAFIRLAACLGTPLDIIEPCGFPVDDKRIRRAAMAPVATMMKSRRVGSPWAPDGMVLEAIAYYIPRGVTLIDEKAPFVSRL